MQGHRRNARLNAGAAALLLGCALFAAPAEAQRSGHGPRPGGRPPGGAPPPRAQAPVTDPEPGTAEPEVLPPIPLFTAACTGEGVRLTRRTATAVSATQLPPDASRALRGSVAGSFTANTSPLSAAELPNPIYQLGSSATYLIAPAPPQASGAMAASCAVAWRGDDFMDARRVLFPDQADFDLPLTARPSSHANGALTLGTVRGDARLTLSAYNGWNTLRSSPLAPAGAAISPGSPPNP